MNYIFCDVERSILLEKSISHLFLPPYAFSQCRDKQVAALVDRFSGTVPSHGLCFDINLSQNLMTKTHLSQILNKVVLISDRTYKSRVLRGMSEISPRSGDIAIFPIRGCLYHPLSLQLSPPENQLSLHCVTQRTIYVVLCRQRLQSDIPDSACGL